MGNGEYADDANKRLKAGEFREMEAGYLADPQTSVELPDDIKALVIPQPHHADAIDASIAYLKDYNISEPELEKASHFAQVTGRFAGEELIRGGVITRNQYALATADYYGVNYSRLGPHPELLTDETLHLTDRGLNYEPQPVTPGDDFCDVASEYRGWREKPGIFVACEPAAQRAIANMIARGRDDNSQISLTTRKALHYSQFVAKQKMHLNNAINGLAANFPDRSASKIITLRQCLLAILLLGGWAASYAYWPSISTLVIHLIGSIFFLAVTIMRAGMVVAGADIAKSKPVNVARSALTERDLPIYTILVALYKEAGQVDELIGALSDIDWPADRLQILLICEADDPDTVMRCRQHGIDERFQTVICPPSFPRTKPKALNFALPLAKGEFLVLYDAEDRPHHLQLREAHDRFLHDEEIACLQAPLLIDNDRQSWLTRMFAIEYTSLFGLMLPVLAQWGSPMPLGGTSNHFRTNVLRDIGGWDPHNVTEDADLGIRLARGGYQCGTIALPTMEEAPPIFGVWMKQRTRWIKGWTQTFLVHTRQPVRLMRELGLRKSMYFHLVITVIVVSVLIHPFFVASAIYHGIKLSRGFQVDSISLAILAIDAFNLVGAYSTYIAVAILALDGRQRRYLYSSLVGVPIYWLLISMAGWRAIIQLFYNPFYWEKTRHGLATNHRHNSGDRIEHN